MSASGGTDDELLAAYVAGDMAAFEELYGRYERPVFGFILRSVSNRETAEDLLQELFTRVVQAAAGWRGEAKFSTWLFVMARNLCRDHARRMVHRRHASLDAQANEGAPLVERIAGPLSASDHEVDMKRANETIATAVDALPEEQREAFLLRFVSDLPFGEIAIMTNVSENTVKSRVRYALERLRNALLAHRSGSTGIDVKDVPDAL